MFIVGVLADSTLQEALERARYYLDQVDVFELRVDCLADWDVSAIADFQLHIAKPLIFTLRSTHQGGEFSGDVSQQMSMLTVLASLKPAYLDLEYTVPNEVVEILHKDYPSIQFIRSFHDFLATPDDLTSLLKTLIHPAFSVIKLITTAQSSFDCLHVLNLIQNARQSNYQLVAHCMGDIGIPSRILGAALGNCFTYAHLPDKSANTIFQSVAPGLPDIDTLRNIYHIHQLNSQTCFFALLGDPVSQSVGHLFHNAEFEKRELNAVYVKFKVNQAELPLFIDGMKRLPFKGLSITTPLKQAIIPLLDHIKEQDKPLNAINTVCFKSTGLYGCNTDGIGALRALEAGTGATLKGQHVILLGAGGAANSIAFAMVREGAQVIIVNRTLKKAQELAKSIHAAVQAYDFVMLSDNCLARRPECSEGSPAATSIVISGGPSPQAPRDDVLAAPIIINALLASVELPAYCLSQLAKFEKGCLFDINYYHPHSALVEIAVARGWKIINGIGMFYEQAFEQLNFWLKKSPDSIN